MVQIASLRTAADAERFKAQLAMQGIQAKVQTVTVNGKDTYHRVQAGPYQGKQAVNDVRSQLKAKGMDTIADQAEVDGAVELARKRRSVGRSSDRRRIEARWMRELAPNPSTPRSTVAPERPRSRARWTIAS